MPETALLNAPLLEAGGLCTYYGTSQALFDVSLKVPSRGSVAILGRNGAGKTTLLKTLAGDLLPARGSVRFDGSDVARLPTERRMRLGIGYVPQEQGVFGRLTVRENLLIGAMTDPKGKERMGGNAHAVPPACHAPVAAGRYPFGRRAQDAGHQPGIARQAQSADAR